MKKYIALKPFSVNKYLVINGDNLYGEIKTVPIDMGFVVCLFLYHPETRQRLGHIEPEKIGTLLIENE